MFVFKVAAVSSNRNSFGLRGMVLIDAHGEAWEVAANDLNLKAKGETISVPADADKEPEFYRLGFEIPNKLPKAPPQVVAKVWS